MTTVVAQEDELTLAGVRVVGEGAAERVVLDFVKSGDCGLAVSLSRPDGFILSLWLDAVLRQQGDRGEEE